MANQCATCVYNGFDYWGNSRCLLPDPLTGGHTGNTCLQERYGEGVAPITKRPYCGSEGIYYIREKETK